MASRAQPAPRSRLQHGTPAFRRTAGVSRFTPVPNKGSSTFSQVIQL
ncbi:hypothetical protein [Alloactinosynnema sp. L-07]|nr:hypothetical protein [Alloactinosynnema sp. L-07]